MKKKTIIIVSSILILIVAASTFVFKFSFFHKNICTIENSCPSGFCKSDATCGGNDNPMSGCSIYPATYCKPLNLVSEITYYNRKELFNEFKASVRTSKSDAKKCVMEYVKKNQVNEELKYLSDNFSYESEIRSSDNCEKSGPCYVLSVEYKKSAPQFKEENLGILKCADFEVAAYGCSVHFLGAESSKNALIKSFKLDNYSNLLITNNGLK